MYGYATPFWRHFHVVFDVRDLNLPNVSLIFQGPNITHKLRCVKNTGTVAMDDRGAKYAQKTSEN
jgi:hypothetical protein